MTQFYYVQLTHSISYLFFTNLSRSKSQKFSESSKFCFREKIHFSFHIYFSFTYTLLQHNFYYPVKDVTWKNIERDYLKKEKWMSSNPFECRSSTSVTRNKFLDTTTSCIELAFLYDTGILFSKNGFC